jgi:parallel beta-helix repeat protein
VIADLDHHEADGITVTANGAGFTLDNVVVRGFTGDGISLTGVDGFTITHVAAVNNGEYGIFPVFSSHGLIQFSTASGSNDTGIYVGQSSDVAIRNNAVFDNVNGIEIENSTRVEASGNVAFQNTVGIFEDLLPGLTIEASDSNLIEGNLVLKNNRPNTADPSDIATVEPSGLGIVVLGGDHTLVKDNLVAGNGYAGILLASGLDLIALAHLDPGVYGKVDPNPENTLITNNIVIGNGLRFSYPGFPPPADLMWTTFGQLGTNDRWKGNLFGASSPSPLP